MKIFKLLLVGAFALTIGSCENEADPDSVITSFEKFPVTTTTAPVVASETDEGTYVFNFVMDPTKQVNDVHLEIHAGENSTATEGVDFEILTHDVELSAFEGQDGFPVEIRVLEDFEVEGEDETVYLTFTTTSPSGVDESQVLVLTITDSGLEPQAAATAEFELSWAFSDPALANVDACEENIDIDVTFQTQGTDPYDDDLMEYAASTLGCPEAGSITVADMVDGYVYDIWVFNYAEVDYGDLSALTVTLSYDRGNSNFSGSIVVEDVFDSRQAEAGAIIGTIQRNGDTLTIKDADGNTIGSGRSGIKVITGVKKPI